MAIGNADHLKSAIVCLPFLIALHTGLTIKQLNLLFWRTVIFALGIVAAHPNSQYCHLTADLAKKRYKLKINFLVFFPSFFAAQH